jgi:hypothetical protein
MPSIPPPMPSRTLWLTLLGAIPLPAQQAGELELAPCTLELEAKWEPMTDTTYGFEKKFAVVRDLAPAAARATYTDEHFRPFLPPGEVALGVPWRIDAAAALPILRQLHPGAGIGMHHDHGGGGVAATGGFACLSALEADRAEIALRIHAEFLIAGDGEPATSSWFTPAQFRGRLAIDRRTGRVTAFRLAVPDSRANVDVNVAEDDGVIADIGRVPRLELSGGTFPDAEPGAWRLAERQVDQILERAFYPFAAIDWLDLAAARRVSLATGRPLHVVALFGSLADESC